MAAANQYPLEPKPLPPLAGELVNAPVEATPVLPVPARRETTAHEKLEDAAFRAACAWKLCETNGDLAALEERRKEIEASLRSAVQSAKKIERANFAKWVDSKWLLDNFILFRLCLHDVKATFAGAKDLPQVERGKMRRAPRAYAIAESYLETVDYKFDPKSFSIFVNAAQRDASLTFAEIAMMKAFVQLAMLEKVTEIVNAVFASDAPAIQASAAPAEAENGSTAQPVLPAIVPSFRCIVDMAWRDIFEEVSPVARILREDPAAAYAKMDADGRENYRRVIANLSERSTWDEERIARKAVELAATAQAATTLRGRERRAHAGYYLVDGGLKTLRTVIGYRPKISERFHDAILRWPEIAYLIAIEAITLGIMTAIFSIPGAGFAAVLVAILFFFPVLDCAMSIINLLATLIVPPRRLPRLDFSEGLPPECATMVVVPTFLINENQVRKAVRDLEIRFLGNRDANLHFALLTDLPDAPTENDERDQLAGLCSDLVRALNDKYAHEECGTFFHFYRPRTFNPVEDIWMGWERKRGKLLEFNHLLLGQEDRFSQKVGDLTILRKIRFVITLDLDTQLPRDAAHKLIGAMAHPLNRAVIDSVTNLVVEGYGILQPRVDISAQSAEKSRFAAIMSGDTGLDVYTRAVSDVYQDLFGEGSFTGKGIYDLQVFQQVLENRFPNDAILSHDLIEGAYARAGLLSDVEVVDDYPSRFSAYSKRKHRWVRGDWQIAAWLFPRVPEASGRRGRNPLNPVSRWKIVDNLRRSVTESATFALLLFGWLVLPGKPLYWTLATLALAAFPSFLRTAITILQARRAVFSAEFWWNTISDLAKSNVQLVFRLAFLLQQSLVTLDAVARTIVRMTLTRRHLLNWETAAEAEANGSTTSPSDVYLEWTPLLSLMIAALIAATRPQALLVAAPFLLVWATSKSLSRWLDRPRRKQRRSHSTSDRQILRHAALRTWRFFREFSTADENWLIPDTVQEDGATIVHRVSPTNLGFLLSSRLGALDLGFLTLPEFIAATERTLETAREMPKQKGHFYNWYNTLTLEPDSPRFLSTVDNGNLVCSLWTLKQGCLEAQSAKIFPRAQWQGILDHLDLICEMLSHGKRQVLARKIEKLKNDLPSLDEPAATWLNALPDFETAFAATAEEAEASSTGDEVRWWVRELRTRVHKLIELVYDFAPWLSPVYATLRENHAIADGVNLDQMTLENAPQATERVREQLKRVEALESTEIEIHAAISLLREALSRSAILCVVTPTRLEYLAEDADELAAAMDFKFLYNPQRKLLSVGYDAEAKQLNEAHYDLLASEARAAAFVAIAKGEIPQESWFKLSRSHLIVGGTPVLLSWTGTMFEYLLPCLWMKSHPNTLLAHNERAAFRSQQKYAKRKSIPWGISECASSEKMAEGAYRYHAFGVPDLALSHEDGEDLMVAPYSTFLGLLVDAEGSVKNLKRLAKMRLLGAYGFYEGADFTPSRLGADGKCAIARCWLAHHQGMSLVAAASVLCGLSMQRRFHAEPMVGATERILHERMPRMLKVSPSGIAGAVASTLIGQGRLALQRARSWSSTSPELTLPVHRAG